MLGQVYQEQATRRYYLSLGFMKYVCLAVPLQEMEEQGEARASETSSDA